MGLFYGSLCCAYVFLIYSLLCYVLCLEYPRRLVLWILSLLFTVHCFRGVGNFAVRMLSVLFWWWLFLLALVHLQPVPGILSGRKAVI